jgi:16S rRNA processing protein RimM
VSASEPFVSIARVVKTQGRHGELAADLLTDFPEKFSQRKVISALLPDGTRRECRIEDAWFHKGRVILKIAGVDSISSAEELVGAELQVPFNERTPLEAGTYYASELIGCRVFDASSGQVKDLGEVSEIRFGAGEAPLLVIAGAEGKELLAPFVEAYISAVDLAGKKLELKLPEGMLEIDKPLTAEEKEEQQRR